jgi:hypothetical protein
MAIKDSVLAWFVKEYIIPNAQVLDKPGFIVFNISGRNPLTVRQTIVPENLFTTLEKKCIEQMGTEGKKLLYSIGKKFGYSFAIMGSFQTKKDTKKNELISYIKLVNKFIEGTYASQIDGQTDYERECVTFFLKNFVVCNKIGFGYFLPLGAGTGLVAKLFENEKIEGIHIHENDIKEKCTIVCAPPTFLQENYPNDNFFVETDMNGLEMSSYYRDFNKTAQINSSNHSFRKYLETGLFQYDHGIVTYKNSRFFIYEVTGLYLLSIGFESNQIKDELLFQSAFESGVETIKSLGLDKKNIQSLIDILVAFGWGDPTIKKTNDKVTMNIKYFPWTKYTEISKFTIFRGIFSGYLSGFSGREIILKKVEKNIQNGFFELTFME